jgi:hypothetical protein
MNEEQWNEYCNRSKTWAIRIGYELLHSRAFKDLDYGPALKVLNWMYEKIRVEKIQGKRGKNRFQVKDNGQFSFLYKEANLRGLSDTQFGRALRELHSHGFVDVARAGSARKGDFTIYLLSERWKRFGQPGFDEKEFPKSMYQIDSGFQVGHDFLWKRPKRKKKS